MSQDVSGDFVFGTLASDELRLAQVRAATAGVAHGHDLEPLDPEPGQPITIRATVGPTVVADRVTCYVTTDGADPAGSRGIADVGSAYPMTREALTWDTLAWGYRETWSATIPGQPDGTEVRYRIEAWPSTGGETTWASDIVGVVGGPRPPGVSDLDAAAFATFGELWPIRRESSEALQVDRERVPGWLRDAVIYQVFVDRFATTDGEPFADPETPGGFFGGTLRGVLRRLDHIAGLGATCLWLSPVFPSPSHHGYDATDYRAVEPRLGTEADLRAIVDAAHARGIRVILDFVANHVSSGHAAFQTAVADRDAPETRWFTFTDWPTGYLTFFGVQDHPQLDADDPGARAYLIDSARHWLDLGVDGFRCDYAQGPSHGFWSAFRTATRATRSDSITLGEVVETPSLQRTYAGRLDGCLDFLLLQALRATFAFGTAPVSALDAFVRRHLDHVPPDMVMPTFLDNHDMNRFLWVVRGDARRLRVAAMCQFTLPHPPIVYYGTEVGLSQDRDVRSADGSGHPEESRLPMPWGDAQDVDLLRFYQALVALRQATPALWRAERTTVVLDDAHGLYAYRCEDGERTALVVLHVGDGIASVPLDGSERRIALASDETVVLTEDAVQLPAYSGVVLH